jgi:hypothetical protein
VNKTVGLFFEELVTDFLGGRGGTWQYIEKKQRWQYIEKKQRTLKMIIIDCFQ